VDGRRQRRRAHDVTAAVAEGEAGGGTGWDGEEEEGGAGRGGFKAALPRDGSAGRRAVSRNRDGFVPAAVELPLAEPPVSGPAGPAAGARHPRGDVSPPRTVETASSPPGRAPIDDEKILVFFFGGGGGTDLRSFSSAVLILYPGCFCPHDPVDLLVISSWLPNKKIINDRHG
jgi:hypothetical protein